VYNTISDNAVQGTVHALQGLNASFQLLHEQLPRLTEVIGWSDGATDYTGAAFVCGLLINNLEATTGMKVISHDHSIPGEGKNINDVKNGHVSQGMKRLRAIGGVGSDQQTAQQVGGAMDTLHLVGIQNLIATIANTTVELASPAGITNYYSKERVTVANTVLVRCFTGIGRGTILCIECSDENSEKLQHAIAGVSVPISLSEDGSTSAGEVHMKATRALRTRRAREAARRKAMAKDAREAARLQNPREVARAKLLEEQREARDAKLLQCPTCERRYTISRPAAYERHVLTCGARTLNDTVQERISAAVGTAGRTEEARYRDCDLYTIGVTSITELQELNLTSPAEEGEMRIGAAGVSTQNALVAMLAGPRATLQTVDGDVPKFDQDGGLVISFPAKLVFSSPPLAVLMRGWGRKQPRRGKLTVCEEVDKYLRQQWEANKQVTAFVLAERMRRDFVGDGKVKLQLNEHDCQRWLLRVYQRVRAAAAQEIAMAAATAAVAETG